MKVIKKCLSLFLLLIVVVISFNGVSNENITKALNYSHDINSSFADNRILVHLNKDASFSSKEYTKNDFSEIGCVEVTDLTSAATECVIKNIENDLVNIDKYRRILSVKLNKNSKENVLEMVDKLMERSDVYYASPDYKMSTCSTYSNDTYASTQWALDNVNLPEAWDYNTGSSDVLVGIIDSGIDCTHPDLASKIETEYCMSFDDGLPYEESFPYDVTGHGTHVAGIIGAVSNNNMGITGSNWNVGLVSLRVVNDEGESNTSNIVSAINYAQQEGIKILNLSMGFESQGNGPTNLFNMIDSYSGLIVCAAGNDGNDNDGTTKVYPASYDLDNVLSVGAINSNNQRSIWEVGSSNYGLSSVDIYAPGSNILSTFPDEVCEIEVTFYDGTRFCELDSFVRCGLIDIIENYGVSWEYVNENFSNIIRDEEGNGLEPIECKVSSHCTNGYHYMNGTSMAAPYVTGVAALLLSEKPDLTTMQLKVAIVNNGDVILINIPGNLQQVVRKLNALESVKAVHIHEYQYVSIDGTEHRASCYCGYTNTSSHVNDNHRCTICGVYMAIHDYDRDHSWISYTRHSVKCSCGSTSTQSHVIRNGSKICLLCGGSTDKGFIQPTSILSNITHTTKNGSYILSNGIIVLVEEDIESYFKGALSFNAVDNKYSYVIA